MVFGFVVEAVGLTVDLVVKVNGVIFRFVVEMVIGVVVGLMVGLVVEVIGVVFGFEVEMIVGVVVGLVVKVVICEVV